MQILFAGTSPVVPRKNSDRIKQRHSSSATYPRRINRTCVLLGPESLRPSYHQCPPNPRFETVYRLRYVMAVSILLLMFVLLGLEAKQRPDQYAVRVGGQGHLLVQDQSISALDDPLGGSIIWTRLLVASSPHSPFRFSSSG